MENTFEQQQYKKKFPKKTIILGLLGLVIFAGLVVISLNIFHKYQLSNTVTSLLKNVAEAMEKAKGVNGYTASLPSSTANSTKVRVEGGGSFDGTMYCITGTSTEAPSVTYYIDSSSKKPMKGTCQVATSLPKPSKITNIQEDNISANQIRLSWNSAIYAATYSLQCATNDRFSNNVIEMTNTSTTGTCDNLKSGTQYFVRVKGNNNKGSGDWSNMLTITTKELSLAPTGLKLTPISSTKINYSFTNVSGSQSYVIEWSTDINFIQSLSSVAQIGTSGTASGLIPNTRYFFHVKAVTPGFNADHAAFSPIEYVSTS
jgi:hypothetical protein